jgi:hypothetical protein
MKLKQVATALLLFFVGVSVVFLVVKETRPNRANTSPVGPSAPTQEVASNMPPAERSASTAVVQGNAKASGAVAAVATAQAKNQIATHRRTVVAYYFHGNFRCPTCRKIEALSREAVESGFPEDLKAGRLEWHVINVEEPGNEHFIQDYQLFSKALVLVGKEGSKQTQWKNLQEVWTLVGKKEAFIKYVQSEIRAYLGEA